MPPYTESPKPLELTALVPSTGVKNYTSTDTWIAKVFKRRKWRADAKSGKNSRIQRKQHKPTGEDDDGEQSYREELAKYIAEATAYLAQETPSDLETNLSSDDSEPKSPCVTGIDRNSTTWNEYVKPPVEIPRTYRTQDLQGGVLVGGEYVLYTNWAFKHVLRRRRSLAPYPEHDYELPSACGPNTGNGVYFGKVVEL
uniref:Uncharacterized protein n=1 Tax=Peronospora matthiolae TaxID=2874970 RepID=A0AAV1UDJ5_9STRA